MQNRIVAMRLNRRLDRRRRLLERFFNSIRIRLRFNEAMT
jgi:hypothetical protein